MKLGSPCIDLRNRELTATYNGLTRCGRYAVVKYRGERAKTIPVVHLATARMLRKAVVV